MSPKRIIAILLALFLGSFGAHKFFMGQIFLGIMYFLFSWTGIPLIISIVEAILYCCMTDEEFERKCF